VPRTEKNNERKRITLPIVEGRDCAPDTAAVCLSQHAAVIDLLVVVVDAVTASRGARGVGARLDWRRGRRGRRGGAGGGALSDDEDDDDGEHDDHQQQRAAHRTHQRL